MNLYMFYIGGNAGKSNIEVHDIQFVAANKPKDAWPALRDVWFGDKDKIHIDGYRPDTLAELHEFDLFVAENAQQAKSKALKTLLCDADHQHKDNLKDVDDCLLLEKVDEFFITLTPCETGSRDQPEWQGYQPIGL